MIIEYLQPDASIWDAITVVLRAAYYIASLGAAGLAIFAVAFGHRLTPYESERLRRWIGAAVALAILLSLAAAGVRVQILSAGNIGALDVWEAMLRSRIGDAFLLRVAGLLLLLPLAIGARVGPALAGAGALLVIASYAAMGHSTLYSPRQELAGLVVAHLACVAFWAGSLVPLRWVAQRGDRDAGLLVADWSRLAMIAVGLLVASGIVAAMLLLRQPGQLVTSWYGNAMVAKVLLVALVMGLAAINKLYLSARLGYGDPQAGPRLARAIVVEIVLMMLVFYAAAEMVSVHPVDLGHRVPA